MEYCPRPNLQVRARKEPFSVAEALRVGIQVAGAVETARLLIAADGEVTLFEFMLEKALDRHVLAAARGATPTALRLEAR